MLYGTYNYSYWGESKPTNITGGAPHCTINPVLLGVTINQLSVDSTAPPSHYNSARSTIPTTAYEKKLNNILWIYSAKYVYIYIHIEVLNIYL